MPSNYLASFNNQGFDICLYPTQVLALTTLLNLFSLDILEEEVPPILPSPSSGRFQTWSCSFSSISTRGTAHPENLKICPNFLLYTEIHFPSRIEGPFPRYNIR